MGIQGLPQQRKRKYGEFSSIVSSANSPLARNSYIGYNRISEEPGKCKGTHRIISE